MIWPHASKDRPCPICGKPDWCQFGERAIKCYRVESEHADPNGGWYHFYDAKQMARPRIAYKPAEASPAPLIPFLAIMKEWRAATTHNQFELLAGQLGVRKEACVAVGAAWALGVNKFGQPLKAWAFPMKDGSGKVCGIRLRNETGFKWAVDGSRQGVFLPEPYVRLRDTAFIVEGPTDLAAMLTMGLFAIGRPTCSSGNDIICETIKRLKFKRAVVVGDNDEMKGQEGKRYRPGIRGAVALKKDLKVPSVIWIVPSPCKDSREYLQAGGNAALIESDIRGKVWSK